MNHLTSPVVKKKWDKWKEVEGSLEVERIFEMDDVEERENLLKIRQMLTGEGFNPDTFFVHEYPTEGVYICCQVGQKNYFIVESTKDSELMLPTYTTMKPDKDGNNCFSCETIKDSIRLTEF